MSEVVDQCRRENCCTFVHTGITELSQKFYVCETCTARGKLGENEGVCEICAKLCHNGHAIAQSGKASYYCVCGATGCNATKAAQSMCLKCGLPLSKNSVYCFNCGSKQFADSDKKTDRKTKVAKEGDCPKCGDRLSSRNRFCESCGYQAKEEKNPHHHATGDEKSSLKLLDVEPETTELKFEGVFLDVYRLAQDEDRDLRMQWVVRNTRQFNPVEIEFDFTGSSGLNLNGPFKQKTLIPVESTRKVAEIKSADPDKGYALSLGFAYKLLPKDAEAIRKHNEKQLKGLEDKMASFKTTLGSSPSLDAVKAAAKSSGSKFVDPEFPPKESSIHKDGKTPQLVKDVTWQRPEAFMKSVNLFEGIDPGDINQGMLGNCWFCCALSSLAEFPHLIQDIFHPDSRKTSDTGAYLLRFYNETDRERVNIVVDDFFPCKAQAGPIFTHNKGNEIWVLLIEKAYAKMFGCYYRLKSGMPGDAFSDLTGCPVEAYSFQSRVFQNKVKDGTMFKTVLEWDRRKCVMAAGKYGEDKFTESGEDPSNKFGLVPGHAYSLIEAKEHTGKGVQLVKLRNPWGRFEWKGDWSDHSKMWTKEMKDYFKPVFADDDGIFWMSFKHFILNFDNIEVCFATAPDGKPWNQKRFQGTFKGEAPFVQTMWKIEVGGDTNIFFSMFQPDQRDKDADDCLECGVLCIDERGTLHGYTEIQAKNRTCGQTDLKAGTYYVIPLTVGCKLRDRKPADFIFAIHASRADAIDAVPEPIDLKLLEQARLNHLKAIGNKQTWNGHTIWSYIAIDFSSFAIEAAEDKQATIEFTLDFSNSVNVYSPYGELARTKAFKPGQGQMMQDLAALDPKKGMSVRYGIQARQFQ